MILKFPAEGIFFCQKSWSHLNGRNSQSRGARGKPYTPEPRGDLSMESWFEWWRSSDGHFESHSSWDCWWIASTDGEIVLTFHQSSCASLDFAPGSYSTSSDFKSTWKAPRSSWAIAAEAFHQSRRFDLLKLPKNSSTRDKTLLILPSTRLLAISLSVENFRNPKIAPAHAEHPFFGVEATAEAWNLLKHDLINPNYRARKGRERKRSACQKQLPTVAEDSREGKSESRKKKREKRPKISTAPGMFSLP